MYLKLHTYVLKKTLVPTREPWALSSATIRTVLSSVFEQALSLCSVVRVGGGNTAVTLCMFPDE